VREIEGDFAVRVHVAGDFAPPNQAAVLLALADDEKYVRIDCGKGPYPGSPHSASTGVVTRGILARGQHHPATTTSLWLRLERQGGTIRTFFSYDGENWILSVDTSTIELKDQQPVTYTGPLQIALLTRNPAKTPLAMTWEHFSIEPIEQVSLTEDPVERAHRERNRQTMLQLNRVGCGITLTLAAIWGWIAWFARRETRCLHVAMSVYLVSMALPAVKFVHGEGAMFGWYATIMSLLM
jgi:regulation of enolase protein 1 (concanavalin A-like superfamily)